MDSKSAVRVLSALAQENRLAIFRLLVSIGPAGLTPGKISEQLDVPHATLSFHLKDLSYSGLITSRKKSRFVIYSANYEVMNDLLAFLTENCCSGSICETSSVKKCKPIKRRMKN